MQINLKKLSGSQCCRRYQKDYIARTNTRSESATLECIKFYMDGRIRFEQHCYGEAAGCIFSLWAKGMDPDGTLHWDISRNGYFDSSVLPSALVSIDENGWLYFDQDSFPWKLSAELDSDPSAGYSKWKVLCFHLFHHE